MRFVETPIHGAFLIDLEPRADERGFFARLFDEAEFGTHGLERTFPQINTSFSTRAGTLRGLHYQVAPKGEAKLVKCLRGAIFDVIVDMRGESPTFKQWYGVELNQDNRTMLYVPQGCAHGFLTLVDSTEVMYPASSLYAGGHERGLRWNDPAFGISWVREPSVLSSKDAQAPDFDPDQHLSGY